MHGFPALVKMLQISSACSRNSFVDIIGESLDSLEADIISNNTEE